jgi:hypothetical protein
MAGQGGTRAAAGKKPVGPPAKERRTPVPNWQQHNRPLATIRRALFLLLDVDPEKAVERRWNVRSSEHSVAKSYEDILRITLHQMLIGNPLLEPLAGDVTRRRKDFEQVLISMRRFIALVQSPFSPYMAVVATPPAGLLSLRVEEPYGGLSTTKRLELVARHFGSGGEGLSDDASNVALPPEPAEVLRHVSEALARSSEGDEAWTAESSADEEAEDSVQSKKEERLNLTLGFLLRLMKEEWGKTGKIPQSMFKGEGRNLRMDGLAALLQRMAANALHSAAPDLPKALGAQFFTQRTLADRLAKAYASAEYPDLLPEKKRGSERQANS